MAPQRRRSRTLAILLKVAAVGVGAASLSLALGYAYDEVEYLVAAPGVRVGDVVVLMATVALALAGSALIAQLPDSLRARFRRRTFVGKSRPVYGFGTMLAVGVGATLGSPLFILIPENVLQYELVSIVSLGLAAALSVAMAKVYSNMYRRSSELGVSGVGGPSFARLAAGKRSVRYFVSRVSMWVANTALAAYTKIVFLVFDFVFMPTVLQASGLGPAATEAVVYGIAAAFIGWTVVNIFFEQKYLRVLGLIQVVLTSALIALLVAHSVALGEVGGWNLGPLFANPLGAGWVSALIINTGYLYLLFFGFQEIQSLEREAVQRSSIPVVSWVKKGFTLDRTAYLGAAMVTSVVVAAALNILYGVAISASQPTLGTEPGIPALTIAKSLAGPGQELLMAIAFLIAAITTFVPAFLAAARHLTALGEDGYMPRSVAGLGWVFTLVAVLLLALGNQDFLVSVTDFMVLVSLGIISLSAVWLTRRSRGRGGSSALPLGVGLSCLLLAGAVYFKDPTVVVFGAMSVIFAYLIFDILELGPLGVQLFLATLGFASFAALGTFQHAIHTSGIVSAATNMIGPDPNYLLLICLGGSSALLAVNVVVDVLVLRRTSPL